MVKRCGSSKRKVSLGPFQDGSKPRLVATDMDGTFLNQFGEYDRERFARVLSAMAESGTRFVVASGNQYYQLRTFFEGIEEEADASPIAYVAENGALVVDDGLVIDHASLSQGVVKDAWRLLSSRADAECALCCVNEAYVQHGSASQGFFELMSRYFPRISWTDDLTSLNDIALKFSIETRNGTEQALSEAVSDALCGALVPVVSGNGSVDLMAPGCTKATGLATLCKRWRLSLDECLAFGDNGNDVEMLAAVGWGVAMDNAALDAIRAADATCPPNTESGVIETLQQLFLD
ncbi:Cof-type HAD-IIB family hydrolase [Olsenella intestinalis]|uniref:Cof-type HAD-IIB family hydrolase n=1 Tax=Olsenella intestinalis TaxID=2930083 RepID=UPI00200F4C4A|nr:Cof-type HAD-IIB family hydrolase [Olsenella intestinalis]